MREIKRSVLYSFDGKEVLSISYKLVNSSFYIDVGSIASLAYSNISGRSIFDIQDKIVSDPEFYYSYLREIYYNLNSVDMFEIYPDLTFGELNEVLRLAIVEYIRSLFPESVRGGILS